MLKNAKDKRIHQFNPPSQTRSHRHYTYAHGWADVQELIAGINATGKYRIDMPMLEEIVRTDNKQRYSFNEDKTKIRANQGHSIQVDVELK